ncbi:velvet factor-domain-containing protein [Mycena floridula]|nr:velvet factor-domain-containing protein [Mycena floridula]
MAQSPVHLSMDLDRRSNERAPGDARVQGPYSSRHWVKKPRSPFRSSKNFILSPAIFHEQTIIQPSLLKTRRLRPSNDDVSLHYHSSIRYSSNGCRLRQSSSGQSSPQSSNNSIFSHNGSDSSQTTPSSQNSFLELPSHHYLGRPQIQGASSLVFHSRAKTYHLEVVQHPQKAAEFRNGVLSRLPITPPIIAQLTVRDTSGIAIAPDAELPFLIAHLSLFNETGQTRLDGGGLPRQRLLYGNLVSSADHLQDLQGNMGYFFLFPDVSIRWRGRFQLGITLLRIQSPDENGVFRISPQGTVLAEARSRPFDVLSYQHYAAAPTTRLTQSFLRQGARMFTYMPQP